MYRNVLGVQEAVVHEPTPAPSFMEGSTEKRTIIHVIIIMCDKNFKKKSWEAVGAIARNSTSGKIMQNTCSLVAYYEGVHSLRMT